MSMKVAKLAACFPAGRDPKQSRPFSLEHRPCQSLISIQNTVEYLEFAREVLDAIDNDQIDESNYELHCGEIGDPLRQVTVVYDKHDQTFKGFFIG